MSITRAMLARLLALLLLCVVGLGSGLGMGGSGTITVTAYFPDSAGLFVGNDVGVLGVPVGRVTGIEPQGRKVKVTLEVDRDHPVPADAGAVVVARSVATDRYVELTPVYDAGPRLADGGQIPLDRTRTPVEFDEVLEAVNDFATGISGSEAASQAVRRIVDSGAAALAGQGQQLHRTIDALGGAATIVDGQKDDLVGTITSLDTLVRRINDNQATVRTFIKQVAAASELLASQREEFRAALRSLDRAVTTVAEFSATNRGQIVKTLDASSTLMRTVTGKQQQVGELLEVLPLVLQNLQRADNGGTLPARMDPLVLAPLGSTLTKLCGQLPLHLCDVLDGTNVLTDLGELLGLPGRQGNAR